jgi:hypothetical protein
MRSFPFKLLICVLLSFTVAAQEKRPPHNGQIKRAGYYNMEVVDCSGYLEIYVYDLDMVPVRNHGLGGVVDFHYPDSTCMTSKIYSYGIDAFTAEPERELYSSCEVFIRGQGIALTALFKDIVCVRPED